MKRIIAVLFFVAWLFSACSQTEPDIANTIETTEEHVIVQNIGFTPGDMASVAVVMSQEITAEISGALVLAEVLDLKKIHTEDIMGIVNFEYDMEVVKVYYSNYTGVSEGEKIPVFSSSGVVQAKELQKLMGGSAHASKFGYLNRDFADNEYFVSSVYDEVVMEVEGQYILYLTDKWLESDGFYVDRSDGYAYEYKDGALYSGTEGIKSDLSLEQLEEQLRALIENRTGIAERIGEDEYMNKLAEEQRAQALKEAQAASNAE